MGLVRKMMSMSSGGLISWSSPEEKVAAAAARDSRANKKVAKEQAALLRAQRKALKNG